LQAAAAAAAAAGGAAEAAGAACCCSLTASAALLPLDLCGLRVPASPWKRLVSYQLDAADQREASGSSTCLRPQLLLRPLLGSGGVSLGVGLAAVGHDASSCCRRCCSAEAGWAAEVPPAGLGAARAAAGGAAAPAGALPADRPACGRAAGASSAGVLAEAKAADQLLMVPAAEGLPWLHP
jgi:hypothetical protein